MTRRRTDSRRPADLADVRQDTERSHSGWHALNPETGGYSPMGRIEVVRELTPAQEAARRADLDRRRQRYGLEPRAPRRYNVDVGVGHSEGGLADA